MDTRRKLFIAVCCSFLSRSPHARHFLRSFYYNVSASTKALSPFSHRALLFSCFVDEQAALPQGIVPFVFAKEYNLHPDILSTA
jgi:hypothetical protein